MKTETVQEGKRTHTIYTAEGTFDKAYSQLKANKLSLTPAEQLAKMRRFAGKSADVSQYGSWVSEGHIYQPKDPNTILIVDAKHNPILQNPTDATNAHRKGNEFYVDTSQLLNRAESDARKARKSGVLALPRNAVAENISVDALADNSYFAFTLGKEAKLYGQFLKSEGIKNVPVYLVSEGHTKKQDKDFARQLWVGRLGNGSEFCGVGNNLGYDSGGVRGVQASTEGASLKNAEATFTYSQLMRMVKPHVKKAELSKLEKKVARRF